MVRRGWVYAVLTLMAAWLLIPALLPRETDRPASAGFQFDRVSPWEYLRTQPGVILHYLRLAFWPDHLCLDYKWPVAQTWKEILLPGAVVLGLLSLTTFCLFRYPRLGFLTAAFFLILSPTSSIMPIADLAFEHRMYLPLAAVITFTVLSVFALFQFLVPRTNTRRDLMLVILALVALALIFRTSKRNREYSDPVMMWQSVVNVAPHNERAHSNLAYQLQAHNRHGEALEHCRRALEINPNFSEASFNLGVSHAALGQRAEAIRAYKRAIELKFDYADAYFNLGNLHARDGEYDQAIENYGRTLQIRPSYARAHYHLALVFLAQGLDARAVREFQTAIELEPESTAVQGRLAWLLATSEDPSVRNGAEALRLAKRIQQVSQPKDPGVLDLLAAAYAETGQFARAVETAQQAVMSARANDQQQRAAEIDARLTLYSQNQAYRDKHKKAATEREEEIATGRDEKRE